MSPQGRRNGESYERSTIHAGADHREVVGGGRLVGRESAAVEACQRIDIAETLYRSRPTKLVVDRALAKAILQAASKLIF